MGETEVCYHIPVMLGESLDGLCIVPDGVYVDLTFGGGGHARGILERLGSGGRLYGFDHDADAEANMPDDPRFVFVRSNFRYLSNFMRYHGQSQVDGILADLGVSSHHFDDETRGFSFRFDTAADMRMNSRGGRTALDILNTYPEDALASMFRMYGEVKPARKLAAAIVSERRARPIHTTSDLARIARPFAGRDSDSKFLAQVFQSLRIEVNDEILALREMLYQSLDILRQHGRIAVITYHSLEDRMVKNFFRTGDCDGDRQTDVFGNRQTPLRPVNNKVITPSDEELAANPRARSAKLRIAEKI